MPLSWHAFGEWIVHFQVVLSKKSWVICFEDVEAGTLCPNHVHREPRLSEHYMISFFFLFVSSSLRMIQAWGGL